MKRGIRESRNILLYYVLSFGMNCFFLASNWMYFWIKYMTFGQLGWIDGIAFGFALLLEIPSGAIADLLGKKRTIMTGTFCGALGAFIIAGAKSLPVIFWGWMIVQIAYAFFSGAGEALAYDTLVEEKREHDFEKVAAKSRAVENFATAITTLIGGFVFEYNFRLPHYLWGGGFLLAFIASLFLREPIVDTLKFSFKIYFQQLVVGLKELFAPILRKYIIFILVLSGVYYLYSWGFLRPAMADSFGFFAKEQSIILASLTFLGVFVVQLIPLLKSKFSDMTGLMLLTVLMAGGFLAAAFPIGYFGIFAMLAIAIAGKLADPWISIVVNHAIPSKYRATTLSTVALITRAPYVLIAVVAGNTIQRGNLVGFNMAIAMTIIAVLIMGVFLSNVKNRDED